MEHSADPPSPPHHHECIPYLCTVLGLGHSDQKLEYGLGLGHQRGDGVDDGGELWVRFNTCKTTELGQPLIQNAAPPVSHQHKFWLFEEKKAEEERSEEVPGDETVSSSKNQNDPIVGDVLKYSTTLMCFENVKSLDH